MTTLFSFLGTSSYDEVEYTFEGQVAHERFTQAAILQMLPVEQRPVAVVVAVTKDAYAKNWPALRDRLFALGFHDGSVTPVDIPDGHSEAEIWQIFDEMSRLRGPVVFDCTHGFRSLPIVGALALPFYSQVHGFGIVRLLYGAFQAAAHHKPIVNLTPMLDLPVWAQAIGEWERTGRAQGLEERLSRPIERLRRALTSRTPKELGQLPSRLGELSDALAVIKLDDIVPRARSLHDLLNGVAEALREHGETAPQLRPLQPLIARLSQSVKALCIPQTEVHQGLAVADWYSEKARFPEAYTALRETATSAILKFAAHHGLRSLTEPDGTQLGEADFRSTVDGWAVYYARQRTMTDGDVDKVRRRPHHDAVFLELVKAIDHGELVPVLNAINLLQIHRNQIDHGFTSGGADVSIKRNKQSNQHAVQRQLISDAAAVDALVKAIETACS